MNSVRVLRSGEPALDGYVPPLPPRRLMLEI